MKEYEIEKQVAEGIFGFTNVQWNDAFDVYNGADANGDLAWIPPYSRNLKAAWEIFEWFAARGMVRICNGDGDSCDVDLLPWTDHTGKERNLRHAHVSAETYPLAICRAALLALQSPK